MTPLRSSAGASRTWSSVSCLAQSPSRRQSRSLHISPRTRPSRRTYLFVPLFGPLATSLPPRSPTTAPSPSAVEAASSPHERSPDPGAGDRLHHLSVPNSVVLYPSQVALRPQQRSAPR